MEHLSQELAILSASSALHSRKCSVEFGVILTRDVFNINKLSAYWVELHQTLNEQVNGSLFSSHGAASVSLWSG